MSLAPRGYKTGHVPLIPRLAPPRELLDLNPHKVFGLLVDAGSLLTIRKARARTLGVVPYFRYAQGDAVATELQAARRRFRARGWRAADPSGPPPGIGTTACFAPLRDEGEAYVQRLIGAGVPVRPLHEPELVHGYANADGALPTADAALERLCAALRERLPS